VAGCACAQRAEENIVAAPIMQQHWMNFAYIVDDPFRAWPMTLPVARSPAATGIVTERR
jgi:hypothetical protein